MYQMSCVFHGTLMLKQATSRLIFLLLLFFLPHKSHRINQHDPMTPGCNAAGLLCYVCVGAAADCWSQLALKPRGRDPTARR